VNNNGPYTADSLSHDRIMAVIGAESSAGSLIQKIKQGRHGSQIPWFIVCVEPRQRKNAFYKKQFNENLTYALLSGAKVIHLLENSLSDDISGLINRYQISHLIIGNFNPAKLSLQMSTAKLIKRIQKQHPGMEISEVKMKDKTIPVDTSFRNVSGYIKEYMLAILAVTVTAAICFLVNDFIGYQTVGLIFLILTALLSLFLGRGPVLLTALLNFMVWNFFFIPPILTFHIDNLHDIIVLFANLAVAVTGGTLINRLRKNQADLEMSKKNITLLYSLLESLNNASSIRDLVSKVRDELKRHFNADAILYLKEKNGAILEKRVFGNPELFNDEEFEYAGRMFELKEPQVVRSFNDHTDIQYYPLISQSGALGVIGISTESGTAITDQKLIFLKSFITQISSALEREIAIDKAKETQVYEESQKLFQTVLNSVSHELRTPVSVISSAAANLMDEKTSSDPENRRNICRELESSATRLNQITENILDMSKIESGYLSLDLQSYDVSDLIGVVAHQMKEDLTHHVLRLMLSEPLPSIRIDINWMKQAIQNILRNAIYYTPAGSEIIISASASGNSVSLHIDDNGPGVPKYALPYLFDKFYRVPGSRSGGTGLGLTISKALIEAHGGTINAVNRPGKGLSVIINIPIAG